jgi:hypothetical protein
VESVPFPKDSKDVDDRRLGVTAYCETLKAHSCASHVRTTETEFDDVCMHRHPSSGNAG